MTAHVKGIMPSTDLDTITLAVDPERRHTIPTPEGQLWTRLADFDTNATNNPYARSVVSTSVYTGRIADAYFAVSKASTYESGS